MDKPPKSKAGERPYLENLEALQRNLAKARANEERVVKEQQAAEAEEARLEQQIGDDAVSALLGDRQPSEPDPEVADRLRSLKTTIAAAKQGLPILRQAVEEAAAAVTRAEAEFTGAQLLAISKMQDVVTSELADLLGDLAPLMARLRAIDALREKYSKLKFVGEIPRSWAGAMGVARIIAAIPERLQRPPLNEASMTALAATELQRLAQQLKEEVG